MQCVRLVRTAHSTHSDQVARIVRDDVQLHIDLILRVVGQRPNVVPVECVKAYRGNSFAPLILTLDIRWIWVVSFTPLSVHH
jgi:hypothetical protein